MSYGGAVTASEFAIEKISGVFLGGSGTTLDKLTTGSSNKALTKFGTFAAKSGLNRVVSEFATEALEESIGEFWGVILWNNMVAQNDESLLKTVDVKDIVTLV